MLKHDLAGAQALDTGQLDIVAGQLIHHVAAGPQGIACNGCQRKAGTGVRDFANVPEERLSVHHLPDGSHRCPWCQLLYLMQRTLDANGVLW